MTRRDWLKLTTAAGGAALLPNVTGILGGASAASQSTAAGRERLLADFGWRFHLGHADDPRRISATGAAARSRNPAA